MATKPEPPLQVVAVLSYRDRLIQWGVAVLAAILAVLGARWGIVIPPPPMPAPEQPAPTPPTPQPTPPEPTPDPLSAIVQISSGGVGCSATVIGPRRPDGRWWVLTAAHCVERTGQRWTMRFRDGRTAGSTVVSFDRTADYSWMVTDSDSSALPFALLADATPANGTRVWHAGYGVDQPANREDGTVTGGRDSNGQMRFRLSVSSGDSGGGIVLDTAGRVVSCVCCTTRRGEMADCWGAAVESIRAGRRDTVDLWQWNPIDIPLRPVPKDMPPAP